MFLLSFFPIVVAAITAFRSIEPEIIELVRSTGAGRLRTFRMVQLPHALPALFGGFKVAAALAATAAVVAEFVASDRGLGYLLLQYNGNLDTAGSFAAIFILSRSASRSTAWSSCWRGSPCPGTFRGGGSRAKFPGSDGHHRRREDTSMRRRLLASLFGICLALGAASHARAEDKVTFRLNWLAYGFHAPFYYGVASRHLSRAWDRPDDRRRPGLRPRRAGRWRPGRTCSGWRTAPRSSPARRMARRCRPSWAS